MVSPFDQFWFFWPPFFVFVFVKVSKCHFCRESQEKPQAERFQKVGQTDGVPGELLWQAAQMWSKRDPKLWGDPLLHPKGPGPAAGLHQELVRLPELNAIRSCTDIDFKVIRNVSMEFIFYQFIISLWASRSPQVLRCRSGGPQGWNENRTAAPEEVRASLTVEIFKKKTLNLAKKMSLTFVIYWFHVFLVCFCRMCFRASNKIIILRSILFNLKHFEDFCNRKMAKVEFKYRRPGLSLSLALRHTGSWSWCPMTFTMASRPVLGSLEETSLTPLSPRPTVAWLLMRLETRRTARSRWPWTRSWTFWSKTLQVRPNGIDTSPRRSLGASSLMPTLFCSGWWLVESENKRLAWFPAPYLEVLDGEDEDDEGNLGGESFSYDA